MTDYRIFSKQGADHGVWAGETPDEAFAAMCRSEGDEPQPGEMQRYVVVTEAQYQAEQADE